MDPEQRARLESDVSRLGLEGEDLSEIVSGPLGQLLGRFSEMIPDYRKAPNRSACEHPIPPGSSPSAEIREILQAQSELEAIDPLWFAGWEEFEESLETDD